MARKKFKDKADNINLYFNIWCNQTEYTQADPWKIQQIVAQDTQTAAKMFVRDYDRFGGDMFFAKNCLKRNIATAFGTVRNNIIIHVQDWRGRIAKFQITIENHPEYIARRI